MAITRPIAFLLGLSLLSFSVVSTVDAQAGTKRIKNPTIKMKSGNRTGLHYLYAWDKRCRTIPVSFRKMKAEHGRLYTVNARFRITKKQDRRCGGKTVFGKKVVFKADRNYRGRALVQYRVKSRNVKDAYIVSRRLIIR